MEEKIFKELLHEIVNGPNFHSPISSISTDPKASTVPTYRRSDTEMSSIANRISTLSKFHWSVFGDYYTDYLKANQGNK